MLSADVLDEMVSLIEAQAPIVKSKPLLWLAYGAYQERKLRWLQRHDLAKDAASQAGDIDEWFASVHKSQLRDDVDAAVVCSRQLVWRRLITSD